MKYLRLFSVLLVCVGVVSSGKAADRQDATLLIVPREDGPIKVGLDVGSLHPTILINYQILPSGTVSLLGWSGTKWVGISPQSYMDGSFFKKAPGSAVIVIAEGKPVPSALIPNSEWCPSVYRISTTKIRPLLHLIGRHYDFSYKDWEWFASNYQMDMASINPDGLNVAWYHRSLQQNVNKGSTATGSDLRFFSVIRYAEALPEEPVLDDPLIPEQDAELEEAADDEEIVVPVGPEERNGDPDEGGDVAVDEDNPLTQEAPDAIILEADSMSNDAELTNPDGEERQKELVE